MLNNGRKRFVSERNDSDDRDAKHTRWDDSDKDDEKEFEEMTEVMPTNDDHIMDVDAADSKDLLSKQVRNAMSWINKYSHSLPKNKTKFESILCFFSHEVELDKDFLLYKLFSHLLDLDTETKECVITINNDLLDPHFGDKDVNDLRKDIGKKTGSYRPIFVRGQSQPELYDKAIGRITVWLSRWMTSTGRDRISLNQLKTNLNNFVKFKVVLEPQIVIDKLEEMGVIKVQSNHDIEYLTVPKKKKFQF